MSFNSRVSILLLIILIGCKAKEESNNIIEYNIVQGIEKDEHIYLSEIAENIVSIPLETKRECLIADIRDIDISSDYILIKDDMDQVLLFSISGKFIKRIGQKGKGPNDYLSATKVKISQKNSEIYLFDASIPKIMVFDLESGHSKESYWWNSYWTYFIR